MSLRDGGCYSGGVVAEEMLEPSFCGCAGQGEMGCLCGCSGGVVAEAILVPLSCGFTG